MTDSASTLAWKEGDRLEAAKHVTTTNEYQVMDTVSTDRKRSDRVGETRPVGKPPKFKSPEDLKAKITAYFELCENMSKVPNKAGLALALDTTRETLSDYEDKPEYSDAIKIAYTQIENAWVDTSISREHNAAGAIFYLKNAFHYRDQQNIDHTTKGEALTVPSEIYEREATRGTEANS